MRIRAAFAGAGRSRSFFTITVPPPLLITFSSTIATTTTSCSSDTVLSSTTCTSSFCCNSTCFLFSFSFFFSRFSSMLSPSLSSPRHLVVALRFTPPPPLSEHRKEEEKEETSLSMRTNQMNPSVEMNHDWRRCRASTSTTWKWKGGWRRGDSVLLPLPSPSFSSYFSCGGAPIPLYSSFWMPIRGVASSSSSTSSSRRHHSNTNSGGGGSVRRKRSGRRCAMGSVPSLPTPPFSAGKGSGGGGGVDPSAISTSSTIHHKENSAGGGGGGGGSHWAATTTTTPPPPPSLSSSPLPWYRKKGKTKSTKLKRGKRAVILPGGVTGGNSILEAKNIHKREDGGGAGATAATTSSSVFSSLFEGRRGQSGGGSHHHNNTTTTTMTTTKSSTSTISAAGAAGGRGGSVGNHLSSSSTSGGGEMVGRKGEGGGTESSSAGSSPSSFSVPGKRKELKMVMVKKKKKMKWIKKKKGAGGGRGGGSGGTTPSSTPTPTPSSSASSAVLANRTSTSTSPSTSTFTTSRMAVDKSTAAAAIAGGGGPGSSSSTPSSPSSLSSSSSSSLSSSSAMRRHRSSSSTTSSATGGGGGGAGGSSSSTSTTSINGAAACPPPNGSSSSLSRGKMGKRKKMIKVKKSKTGVRSVKEHPQQQTTTSGGTASSATTGGGGGGPRSSSSSSSSSSTATAAGISSPPPLSTSTTTATPSGGGGGGGKTLLSASSSSFFAKKSLVQQNPLLFPDYREQVLRIFQQLQEVNTALGEVYKSKSYHFALQELRRGDYIFRVLPPNLLPLPKEQQNLSEWLRTHPEEAATHSADIIANWEKRMHLLDPATVVPGVGDKLRGKIIEILETGDLCELHAIYQRPEVSAMREICKVHGFGPRTALSLFRKHKISTVGELKKMAAGSGTGSGAHHIAFNDGQKLGLAYFDDIQRRIPHAEGTLHEAYLKERLTNHFGTSFSLMICGSFRRRTAFSGDIDILLTPYAPAIEAGVEAVGGKEGSGSGSSSSKRGGKSVDENGKKTSRAGGKKGSGESRLGSKSVADRVEAEKGSALDGVPPPPPQGAVRAFVEALRADDYIQATFALGTTKFMGMGRLKGSPPAGIGKAILAEATAAAAAEGGGGGGKHQQQLPLPSIYPARRIDVRYVDAACFPAASLYFTGSKNFNVMMRARAVKMHLVLNEYGLFKQDFAQAAAAAAAAAGTGLGGSNSGGSIRPSSPLTSINELITRLTRYAYWSRGGELLSQCRDASTGSGSKGATAQNKNTNSHAGGGGKKGKPGKLNENNISGNNGLMVLDPAKQKDLLWLVHNLNYLRVPAKSEQDIFTVLGMVYVEPWERCW